MLNFFICINSLRTHRPCGVKLSLSAPFLTEEVLGALGGGEGGSGPWEKHNPWPLYSTCSTPLHPHPPCVRHSSLTPTDPFSFPLSASLSGLQMPPPQARPFLCLSCPGMMKRGGAEAVPRPPGPGEAAEEKHLCGAEDGSSAQVEPRLVAER